MAEQQDPQSDLQAELMAKFNRSVGLAGPEPGLEPTSSATNTTDILKNITGNPFSGANPGLNTPGDTSSYVDSISSFIKQAGSDPGDSVAMRPYTYNGEYDGAKFERYYNTRHFNQLGFNPYHNNEDLYNQAMTFGDEFSRAAGQWPSLLKSGFMSGIRSWKDMFSDPLAPDVTTAREMQQAMGAGSSTKPGIGSFFTNTFLNSAYTVGVGAELVLEELALAGATALTVGTASELTLSAAFTRALKAGERVSKLKEGSKLTIEGFKNLDITTDSLRTFWNTTGKGLGRVAGAFNPLENTWEVGKEIYRGTNKLQWVGAGGRVAELARWTDNFGRFAKDMLLVKTAVSESKLEGGMVQLDVIKDLSDQYREEHGQEPMGEDLKKIEDIARGEAKRAALWNMPAILWSNKLMYETLFAPFEKGVARVSGDIIADAAKPGGKLFHAVGSGLVERARAGVKALTSPKSYGTFAMGYLKANLAEGIQENIQEAISYGAKEYAKAIYNDPSRAAYEGYMGHFMTGMKEQASLQGLETFAGGFLMGAMAQPVMSAPMWASKTIWNNTIDRKNYAEYKQRKEEAIKKQVDVLNDAYEKILKYHSPELASLGIQDNLHADMITAVTEGNKANAKDIQFASIFEGIHTALSSGHYDEFISRMEELKKLSPKEVSLAFGNSENEEIGQKGLRLLDQVIERAKGIRERYEEVNASHPNPFNPGRYKKNTPEYHAQEKGWVAHNLAQKHLIFAKSAFDDMQDRLRTMADAFISSSRPIEKADSNSLLQLLDLEQLGINIEKLKTDAALLDPSIPEQKKTIDDNLKEARWLEDYLKTAIFFVKRSKIEGINLGKVFKKNIPVESHVELKGEKNPFLVKRVITKEGEIKGYVLQDVFTGEEKETSIRNVKYIAPEEAESRINREADSRMKGAFSNYLQYLAKKKGTFFFNEKMFKAFNLIVDTLNARQELKGLVDSINVLFDPQGFIAVQRSIAETIAEVNRKEKLGERLIELSKKVEWNNALNTLAEKAGVFPTEEYWGKFVAAVQGDTDPPLPTSFTDLLTLEEITSGEKFDKAIELWKSSLDAIKGETKEHLTAEAEAKKKAEEELKKKAEQKPEQKPQAPVAKTVTYDELSPEIQTALDPLLEAFMAEKDKDMLSQKDYAEFMARPATQSAIEEAKKKTGQAPVSQVSKAEAFNKLSIPQQFDELVKELDDKEELHGKLFPASGTIKLDDGRNTQSTGKYSEAAPSLDDQGQPVILKKIPFTKDGKTEDAIGVFHPSNLNENFSYVRKNEFKKEVPKVKEAKQAPIQKPEQQTNTQQEAYDRVLRHINDTKVELDSAGNRIINGELHPLRVTKAIEDAFIARGKEPFEYDYLTNVLKEYDKESKKEGFTPEKFMEHLKTAVKPLFAEKEVRGKKVQILTPKKVQDILNGFNFITGFKKNSSRENLETLLKAAYYKHTADRGTLIDKITREYLDKGSVEKPEGISQKAFEDLLKILSEFKKELEANGEKIISTGAVVYGLHTTDTEISGETDLIVVTPEGKLKIYDIKTSDEWSPSRAGVNIKKQQYDFQLSIYKNLLEENTGIEVVGIGILPIQTSTSPDGYISEVSNPQKDFPATSTGSLVRVRSYQTASEQIVPKSGLTRAKPIAELEETSPAKEIRKMFQEAVFNSESYPQYNQTYRQQIKDKINDLKINPTTDPKLVKALEEELSALDWQMVQQKTKDNFEWALARGRSIDFVTKDEPKVKGQFFAIAQIKDNKLVVVKGTERYEIDFEEVTKINKPGEIIKPTQEAKDISKESLKESENVKMDDGAAGKIDEMTKDQDQSNNDLGEMDICL